MKVYYLSLKPETPNKGYWDYGLITDLFANRLWKPYEHIDFEEVEVSELPEDDKAVVVIPARHHAGLEPEITGQLQKIKHVVLFLMGDEEADFDVEEIKHNSIHIWVQNAHPDKHDKYNRIGTGYPPHIRLQDTMSYEKSKNVYFSGQVTHKNREVMYDAVLEYPNSVVNRTAGFTQGVSPTEYVSMMSLAKVVPCPAGAVIPDSFRTYEALESMAIPVSDDRNSQGTISNYWDWLFGQIVPFPRIGNSDEWYGKIDEAVKNYDQEIQMQTCWWIEWKRNFAYKVKEQLQ